MQKKVFKPTYALDFQQDSTKNQMHTAIRERKLNKVMKLSKIYNFLPQESCSIKGYFWNCMHYASHFQSEAILEYWLKKTYRLFPEQYVQIINEKTCEGWTPLMIATIYNSPRCIDILFKSGGIKLKEKDEKGKTALDLASIYCRSECEKIIQKEISKLSKMGFQDYTNINDAFLQNFKDEDKEHERFSKSIILTCNDPSIEEDERYRMLLLHGERIQCLICLCNKGLIKYTTCCGQPMHSHCKIDRLKFCPNCKADDLSLTWEVEHPERAFTLQI